jgi:prophage regulatory protein
MPTPANDNFPRLMSMGEAVKATSLSRTFLNRLRSEGRFPTAVSLSERRFAFVRQEVDSWIADRIARRDANENRAARAA